VVVTCDTAAGDRKKILALLWHAPQEVITAGGFRRTYEIFKRVDDGVDIVAVDDEPSFLRGVDRPNIRLVEYRIPGPVRRLERRFFWYERALEWIIATVRMVCLVLRLRVEKQKFDAIFVPSSEQIPALLAGIVARYVFASPLVACNLNIDIFPRAVRKPLARLHNRADTVIAISDHLIGQLVAHGVSKPIVKNTVGLDTTGTVSADGSPVKLYDAVFVGRHDTEKGVFDLIEIWRTLTGSLPAARLAMIGSSNPTNRARLDSLISRYGLAERIVRLGTVDERDKNEVIRSSKICLFPSHVEEWGIVPQEALACGLPVVAYDLPVYQENIRSCEAVFCERIGDIDAMAARASELLDEDRFLEYAEIGPRFVTRFDWDTVAEREFRIILGQDRGPSSVGHDSPTGP
jgi:glycosyltransferase involved in cell wall biosynthesis